MSDYQVEYGKIGVIAAVIAVVAVAGYVLLGDDDPVITGEEDSLQLSIQQDEVKPGDTVRIEAHDADGNPVEGVEITANSERVGTTNVNGIQGYSIPEDAETLDINAEHNGDTATITATVEDEEYNVEDSTVDDTDETDDEGTDTEDEDTNGDDEDTTDDEADDSDDDTTDEDDETDETDDEDDTTDEDDGEHGLQLENDPEAGELNTLTVYENGDPVEDETVTLNDEQLDDTTTTSGSLTFTVPNEEEITIEAAGFEETYTVEGYTENGDDEDEDIDPEALNADYNFDPSNPAEFVEVNFDASPSTGTNIQSYSWSSPDTILDENTGEQITHEFTEAGTYTVELEIDGGDQGTDTQTGQVAVDEAPEPDINFRTPTDGSEHEETTLTYDFTVYNAVEGAEYRINAGGNTIQTNLLNEGQNDFEEEITVPEGEFNTLIEVDQAGETFTSETHTVTSGLVDGEPEFVLNSPDGETIETFDQQTDVEFSYTVEERGWAEEASIVLEDEEGNEIDSHTHSITSGETYNYEFEDIPASEDGETYTWTVTDEDEEVSESTNFDTQIVEPDADLELVSHDGETDNYDTFDYFAESDVEANLEIEVQADENMERTWMQCDDDGNLEEETISYDEGETITNLSTGILGGQTLDNEFTETLNIAGDYQWNGEINSDEDGNQLASAGPQTFTTTEQTPEDTADDCADEEGG